MSFVCSKVMEAPQIEFKRKANWSDSELLALAETVKASLPVIKGKHSPYITNSAKRSAWEAVVDRVNAVSTIDRRDVAQCKKKWICVVSQVKKLESARRTDAGGTGGGQPPVNMPLWQEVVLSTIPRCNVSGIDGGVDTADEDTSVRDLKDADDEEEEEGLSVFGKGASGSGVFGKSSSGSVKGKGLSGKPSVSGSQRSAGSSEELEQKRKFLEVEQERLQISKEQLKLKKKKNELLEKANELQTRTAEALEGILVVMREKQLNEILSESLLEC